MSFIVKNTTIISPLYLIAPHSCRGCGATGEALCDRCKKYLENQKYSLPPKCETADLPPFYTIGARDGLLKHLIHDYKYNSVRSLGKTFAELLNHALPEVPNAIIVPLPTIPRHIRERGFDHTKLIAKHLARIRHYKIETMLKRSRNIVQVGADRHTRLEQAKNAYYIDPKAKIEPTTTYILFDDVWTTGASMKAAIKELRDAGALDIIILTLAIS